MTETATKPMIENECGPNETCPICPHNHNCISQFNKQYTEQQIKAKVQSLQTLRGVYPQIKPLLEDTIQIIRQLQGEVERLREYDPDIFRLAAEARMSRKSGY